ncbi:MAG: hypothetical protein RIT35_1290 [Pseudomonadota bacterium]|jgi:ubiquinone biosynthesis protein COQ9
MNVASKIALQKKQILEELLEQVPFEGWVESALELACLKLGFDKNYGDLLFPRGLTEIVAMFWESLDLQMLEQAQLLPLGQMKIRERIFVLTKLHMSLTLLPRNLLQKTLAFYQKPSYRLEFMKLMWNTASHIWYRAGDKSTDYNYYTKRLLLLKLYSSSLTYLNNDQSDEYQDSWRLLNSKIEETIKMGQLPGKIARALKNLPFIRLLRS